MLFRFCLYGFLKNQRYFEPFLFLALLAKGLDYTGIGLLIGFRELAVAVMEIPSGALADTWGRKRCLIVSFLAYIGSFLLLADSETLVLLYFAMFLFAVGDSFRTGTHKALIFGWLRHVGRTDERTRIYGLTRSWSKLGSALSVVIATIIVFLTSDYRMVFYLATIPYVAGIVNFLGYPAAADVSPLREDSVGIVRMLVSSMRRVLHERPIRRLVVESMGFEGVFQAAKDYLQPVLQATASASLGLWFGSLAKNELQRTALMVGPVYLVLYLFSSAASRNAHRFVTVAGGEDHSAKWLWRMALVAYGVVAVAGFASTYWALIFAFTALHVLQNFWRPVLVSRIDQHDCDTDGATILSIESQFRRIATTVLAPLIGFSVDFVQRNEMGGNYWPVGLVGVAAGLLTLFGVRFSMAPPDSISRS